MNLIKIIFLLTSTFLLAVCIGSVNLFAQNNKKIENRSDNCEMTSLKLDGVADKFKKSKKKESYLIIIGGSSNKESSRYIAKRISDATTFLVKFHGIKNEEIVFATGLSSVNETGYLKFYIDGELVAEIKTTRKSRLCFGMGESFDYTFLTDFSIQAAEQ